MEGLLLISINVLRFEESQYKKRLIERYAINNNLYYEQL